jgi:hypothetical protein
MSDLNRVTLSGRLVADPELKYLPSGTAVTNLRLASNRSFTSNGERRDEAVFVDVSTPGSGMASATRDSRSWPTGQLRPEHEGRRRRDAAGGGRGQGRPTVLKAGRVSTARTRLDTVLSSPHPRHP